MEFASLAQMFFELQHNLRLYHWTTQSFARHTASNQLINYFDKAIDRFIEVFIGGTNKPKINKKFNLQCSPMSDKDIDTYLKNIKLKLNTLQITTNDLKNIRDEMIENINQTLYLFTFS